VRLGCYGYILFGKKYSTQYVADSKGYRPVTTHDPITVYPKSGEPRKASFVGDFNEEQARSENIRYFFPDGCKGIDAHIPPFEVKMPTAPVRKPSPPIPIRQPEPPVSNPKLIPPPPSTNLNPPLNTITEILKTKIEPAKPAKSLLTSVKAPITPEQSQTVTSTVTNTTPSKPVITSVPKSPIDSVPSQNVLTKVPAPKQPKQQAPADSCPKSSCCSDDESIAKLVLPIPMKNSQGRSGNGSCGSFAKLIVPINGLSEADLRSLTASATSGTDTAELLKNVLKGLV